MRRLRSMRENACPVELTVNGTEFAVTGVTNRVEAFVMYTYRCQGSMGHKDAHYATTGGGGFVNWGAKDSWFEKPEHR